MNAYRVAWRPEIKGGTFPPDSKLHLSTSPNEGGVCLCGVKIPSHYDCRELEIETGIERAGLISNTRFTGYTPCKRCQRIATSR